MADADVRAEARELLDALNTDSMQVNPATGTPESFNKDTAENTKTLTEQVDEILGNLPKKKTAKEKRDDIVEEAEIQAEATANKLVSSLNPAIGALSKIAKSILGVTTSVLGAGLKLGGLALGFRGAMAAFDEFMQPDQSMKERLIGAITGFLARATTDILNLVGVDVNYEEMKKKIRAFFDRTVKFIEDLPATVEEKFEEFKVKFKETFEYIRDVALPVIYDVAVEVVELGKKIKDFVTESGDDFRRAERKSGLQMLVDDITFFGGNIVTAFQNMGTDFAVGGMRFKNMLQTISAGFYELFGYDEKAAEIRKGMLSLENITLAGQRRRDDRAEIALARRDQEDDMRVLEARRKAAAKLESMQSDIFRKQFLDEYGMSEEALMSSIQRLEEDTKTRQERIDRLQRNLDRTMEELAKGGIENVGLGMLNMSGTSATVEVTDTLGRVKSINLPFSQVDPESLLQDPITGLRGRPILLDEFGDIDPRRIEEIVPLVTQILDQNPELFAGSDERLANAVKMAIEEANLQGSVIIDNSTNDSSQKFESNQPTPGDQGSNFHGPPNEPAVVVGG